jgi:predicted Zn-dependent peptidase
MVTSETLPSGLRLVTEEIAHVRSAAIGVWLTRGSRHEPDNDAGIAHFVEHMLFKGTESRSARQLAQEIDAIGGQMDAFTSKEYAGYYIKVLDEHLPRALDLLSDMVLRPALTPEEILREQGVVLEEIKMVEDTPDDLVHELFSQQVWLGHPMGRPILGSAETVASFTADQLRGFFERTYVAPHLIVSAAGRLEHSRLRDLVADAFASLAPEGDVPEMAAPVLVPGIVSRAKDIEQSHICLGTRACSQVHADRHAALVLNTILGGSISSRLFQHIREDRGLAYSVFSNLATYSDTGTLSVYAGCAAERVEEVVALTLAELRSLREAPVDADELVRAKDHLKGSVMLGLENTSSRMSHLARQEMCFGQQATFDELLAQLEAVTADDVLRVADELFRDGGVAASVVGPDGAASLTEAHLDLMTGAHT